MDVRTGHLDHPDVIALLCGHLQNMHALSPPGSVHAMGLARLRAPDIRFWTAWDGDELLGCAALRALDAQHGEIKSMRTVERHRGRGVASVLLQWLVDEARTRGYARLSLETGTADGFAPAHRLYARFGFTDCAPFGDYAPDPHSRFMTLLLDACVPAR